MTSSIISGRMRVDTCRANDPEVADLALAVALAVRVEPALLRAARLVLAPHLDAGIESDLWFSDLVGSRSSRSIVLDRKVLAALRDDLTSREVPGILHESVLEPEARWLTRARKIVFEAHQEEAPTIQLEEEIVWQTVHGSADSESRIELLFRRAVKAMAGSTKAGMTVARWADRALLSLPSAALDNEAARLLTVGTSARLGARSQVGREGGIGFVSGADWIKPATGAADPTAVGLKLLEGGLVFTLPDVLGSTPLELSGNEARLVTVRWDDVGTPREESTSARVGGAVPLPVATRSVVIETASGVEYQFAARPSALYWMRFTEAAEEAYRKLSTGQQDSVREALMALGDDAIGLSAETSDPQVRRYGFGKPRLFIEFSVSEEEAGHAETNIQQAETAIEAPQTYRVLTIVNVGVATVGEDALEARSHIFVSYSHKDQKWLRRLKRFLKPVLQQTGVDLWDDTRIEAGQEWKLEIGQALASAKLAIVLVSQHYLASSHLTENDLPLMVVQEERGRLKILPIAISRSVISEPLDRYQFLNDPNQPLEALSEAELEQAMMRMAGLVLELLKPSTADDPDTKTASTGPVEVPSEFTASVQKAVEERESDDLAHMAEELQINAPAWVSDGLREIGEAQFQLKAWKAAQHTFEGIRKLAPMDPEANWRLAVIYQRIDDLNASNTAIDRVLRQESSGTRAAELLALKGRNARVAWRDEWRASPAEERPKRAIGSKSLQNALDAYLQAFAQSPQDYDIGIPALFLATIILSLADDYFDEWLSRFDDDKQAHVRYEWVLQQREELTKSVGRTLEAQTEKLDVWTRISQADFALLNGSDPGHVASLYHNALTAPETLPFHLDAVHQQLEFLQQLGVRRDQVNAALEVVNRLQSDQPKAKSEQTRGQPIVYRIYLASPGDVRDEREFARAVIEQIRAERAFRGRLDLEYIAWDQPGAEVAMEAGLTPQEAIKRGLPKPSQCDLVILILWSRMGTPLPAEYTKPDGTAYLSGTEWEYHDAITARKEFGKPLVWVYQRNQVPSINLEGPEFDEKRRQWQMVKEFFQTFVGEDGSLIGGINLYETPDEFRKKFEQHLRDRLSVVLEK